MEYSAIEMEMEIGENVYLKTDINGKATARIMFFNGLSQTPEGPISYLPNPRYNKYKTDKIYYEAVLSWENTLSWFINYLKNI